MLLVTILHSELSHSAILNEIILNSTVPTLQEEM